MTTSISCSGYLCTAAKSWCKWHSDKVYICYEPRQELMGTDIVSHFNPVCKHLHMQSKPFLPILTFPTSLIRLLPLNSAPNLTNLTPETVIFSIVAAVALRRLYLPSHQWLICRYISQSVACTGSALHTRDSKQSQNSDGWTKMVTLKQA